MRKLEYFPWSNEIFEETIKDSMKGNIPCLDIELSARCDLNKTTQGCIYCDSHQAIRNSYVNELKIEEILELISAAKKMGLKWVYVCGLGEPSNDPKFLNFIVGIKKKKVNVSIFSNGIYFSEEDIAFLYENHVNLILKCDSLKSEVFNRLLGGDIAQRLNLAEKIYHTISKLIEIGYSKDKASPSLALSIVPTRYNVLDILDTIEFCKKIIYIL